MPSSGGDATHLLMFTNSYPFGKEETFIETEIIHLSHAFPEIVIFPRNRSDVTRNLPDNVRIDELFCTRRSLPLRYIQLLKSLFVLIFSGWFWVELSRAIRRGKGNVFGTARDAFVFSISGTRDFQLLKHHLRRVHLLQANCLLYSYWFTNRAFAIGLLRRQHGNLRAVSRAHNYDLYERKGRVLPFRKFTASALDQVVPISLDGAKYLQEAFDIPAGKISVSRLGVIAIPGKRSRCQDEHVTSGTLHLQSCAFISPVKRIPLIPEALSEMGSKYPDWKFVWTHIGDGDSCAMGNLQSLVDELPSNVEARLKGAMSNRDVMEFYVRAPDRIFISVSTSEGLPVSIMEAQSFGMPVIATNVGGVAEIVNDENGVLLRSDPTIAEITTAIETFLDTDTVDRKRRSAHENWRTKYNAAENYARFIELLDSIRVQSGSHVAGPQKLPPT